MNTFWARVLTLIMVVGVIFGYNTVLEARENEDTIAKMTAELETGKLKLEQLEAREDSQDPGRRLHRWCLQRRSRWLWRNSGG